MAASVRPPGARLTNESVSRLLLAVWFRLCTASNIAAIASANPSTTDPTGGRTYLGGSLIPSSRATVVRLIDSFSDTADLLNPSTWCRRCTSA
jgi:hypothetical protein